jgi:uncharacterized protein (DUF433 family)
MTLPPFLARDPDGAIRLTGHRIGLYTIVRCYKEGMTPEQMVLEFDTLSLDEIRKVLAFYEQNRREVETYYAACKAELDRHEAEYQPGPGLLKIKRVLEKVREEDMRRGGDPEWANLSIMEKVLRVEAGDTAGGN